MGETVCSYASFSKTNKQIRKVKRALETINDCTFRFRYVLSPLPWAGYNKMLRKKGL